MESIETYYMEVRRAECRPLTRDEEQEMFDRYVQGDQEAGLRILRANLRFVIDVCRSYTERRELLEELICEGNIGLIKALECFDHTKGYKFISYAVWWVKQSIRQYLKRDGVVRYPTNIKAASRAHVKAQRDIEQALQRPVRPEDLMDHLGLSLDNLQYVLNSQARAMHPDGLESVDKGWDNIDSLSEEPRVEADMIEQERDHQVRDICKRILSQREYYVIERLFGFGGLDRMTLEKIGKPLGLTRERVRQIREDAYLKLKQRLSPKMLILGD